MKNIASFLNAEDFLPHGYCLLWRPEVLWLHVASDATIAFAYYGIPIVLFYFVRKRGDLPYEKVFWLLGAFILLCGTSHLASIWVLWRPYFGIEGVLKAATGIVSVATLILSVRLLPQALTIPSSAQLADLNEQLRHNIQEREATQRELEAAYAAMEHTVAARTSELQLALTRLAKSNAELEQFAYITSHDLKEPLRGLGFHAATLLEDYEHKLDDAGVKRLKRLTQIPAQMDALISDLHNLARIGHGELALEETDLNQVVRETEEMLEVLLKTSEARLTIAGDLPLVVCDRTWMGRVFYNLILNAIKYNDKPQPIIEIGCLRNASQTDGADHVFYVRDNGVGIAPEFHEFVFAIFKRLNAEDPNKKGTGMGLTFVRKIIERHGGRIWLESTPGKGTTFFFTLNEDLARAAA